MKEKLLYWLAKPILGLYSRVMLHLDVVYAGTLPEGPKIIAANHPSTIDPFLLAFAVKQPVHMLITDIAFQVPLFGQYLRQAGHIPVIEGKGREAFNTAQQILKAGGTIAIFPEGHLSPNEGGFYKPRSGTARLALSTGAQIIPVGIHFPREQLWTFESNNPDNPVSANLYLSGPYNITFGAPIKFTGDAENWEYVRSVTERLMQRIIELSQLSAHRLSHNLAWSPARTTPV
ncbi:MAG: 1-acyl-sn-glycerol-3-phosphate acyltransferase [Anaerolineae bacterium]|nr:1-acyl-sn-glycerol-3-phosphate acyltransferase [Anaerolineae bacterium]